MKALMMALISFLVLTSCQSQTRDRRIKKVGGPCEGCEAIYEYGQKGLMPVDTLPLFHENVPKLKISGTVYQQDGKTPASDVIVYIYHTNRNGIYQTNGGEKGWARRHGIIRGWIKTRDDGKYTFYTFRPAGYPGRPDPEHIHFTAKEPDKNEYWIDDIWFNDDPRLTNKQRNQSQNRGGSGVVTPVPVGSSWEISRDIILGLNIPDYY